MLSKFVTGNLAAKLSGANLLNSWKVIYLTRSWSVVTYFQFYWFLCYNQFFLTKSPVPVLMWLTFLTNSLYSVFLKTSFFTTSLSYLKSTGSSTNFSHLLYLVHFSIYQYLIYLYQVLNELSQFFSKSHVSNLLHVLNLLLLYNLKNFNSTFNLPPKYFTFGEYLLIYIMSFFVNPTVKTIIVVFLLNIQFIIAFFISFSTLNCFWFVFYYSF